MAKNDSAIFGVIRSKQCVETPHALALTPDVRRIRKRWAQNISKKASDLQLKEIRVPL
jgi:hypothetical protein